MSESEWRAEIININYGWHDGRRITIPARFQSDKPWIVWRPRESDRKVAFATHAGAVQFVNRSDTPNELGHTTLD